MHVYVYVCVYIHYLYIYIFFSLIFFPLMSVSLLLISPPTFFQVPHVKNLVYLSIYILYFPLIQIIL